MEMKTMKKSIKIPNGKGGFTIAELSVVLALLAILTAMITSLSVMISNFSAENSAQYGFTEDCHEVKTALTQWASEKDAVGKSFVIDADGKLTVDGESPTIADTVFTVGNVRVDGISAIDTITFDHYGTDLIKCTLSRTDQKGQKMVSSFVFALRLAGVSEGGEP